MFNKTGFSSDPCGTHDIKFLRSANTFKSFRYIHKNSGSEVTVVYIFSPYSY